MPSPSPSPVPPPPAPLTAGLVLAAGGGRRLGSRPKALLPRSDGGTLLTHAVATLRAGGCSPLHVVIGASADAVRALPALTDVEFTENARWESGLASSLQSGLAALATLSPAIRAVVVLLVDQPTVTPEAVTRLRTSGAPTAAIATYAGRRAHPVLLRRTCWPQVSALATADTGARAFLSAHPDQVQEIPMDPLPYPDDIDTPEDLTRFTSPEPTPRATPAS